MCSRTGAHSRPRGQRRRTARACARFAAPAALPWLLLLLSRACARVEIITENPSPFAAVDPDAPKYVVGLFDDASKAPEAAAGARYQLMTSADGRMYNCSLPPAPGAAGAALTAGEDNTGVVPRAAKEGSTPTQATKSPFELLEPLTAICLYHKDATWTYEVCHRGRVRQFRTVNGAKAEEFSCGSFPGDEAQSEEIHEDTSASGRPVTYVVHRYTDGANCHLTGQPRTAEVRYTCLRDTKENLVASVREFPTCNYVALVSTPLLCKHPAFAPQPEDLRMVSCVPLAKPRADGAAAGGAEAAAGSGAAAQAAAAAEAAGKAGEREPQQQQQPPQSADKPPATGGAAESAAPGPGSSSGDTSNSRGGGGGDGGSSDEL